MVYFQHETKKGDEMEKDLKQEFFKMVELQKKLLKKEITLREYLNFFSVDFK